MPHRRETANDAALREELAQLRADIDSLVGTVERVAGSVAGAAAGAAEGGADGAAALARKARSTASGAARLAREACDDALAEGRRGLGAGENAIRAHPFLSLAVAAGVGVLLGKLLSSRQ